MIRVVMVGYDPAEKELGIRLADGTIRVHYTVPPGPAAHLATSHDLTWAYWDLVATRYPMAAEGLPGEPEALDLPGTVPGDPA